MNLLGNLGGEFHSPPSDLDFAGQRRDKAKDEKEVKKRSSKACDNCRKSKCKCMRTVGTEGDQEGPCSNCLNSGIECTFFGASRKRGPPKGYIDMIENRLHRMEALLGGLLHSEDPRAQALLEELVGDEATRDMLSNDLREATAIGPDGIRKKTWQRSSQMDVPITQPTSRHKNGALTFQSEIAFKPDAQTSPTDSFSSLKQAETSPAAESFDKSIKPDPNNPRQRRRLNEPSEPDKSTFRFRSAKPPNISAIPHTGTASYTLSDKASASASSSEQPAQMTELADVVGQLSLDENSEVRYHGRSSGLYLISKSARFQDFFWNFPKAGVWPAAENGNNPGNPFMHLTDVSALPDYDTQVHLLELYWTYVHPVLPIIYKPLFQRTHLKSRTTSTPSIPNLLLFSIFAIASRYSSKIKSRKPAKGKYWAVGEEYADCAAKLLAIEDGSSKLSTVQALLLISFREIGIGQNARAWNDLGRAIRMAQDIGLFRDVDKWYMPVSKFTFEERQTRKRVWSACIIMDKYFSSYIGRPVAIFERDFDSSCPSEDEPDEHDMWRPVNTDGSAWSDAHENPFHDVKGRAISCFNRSYTLSLIIGRIITNIYAIRVRIMGQSSEVLLSMLDSHLANWFLELPPHLQYHPSSSTTIPPPHILVLHCQFYCALILLHRPFIPGQNQVKPPSSYPSHSIASTAANAIAHIVQVYKNTYGLDQANPFLTYYIFSAAIMLVYNASFESSMEAVSKKNLSRCMDALEAMEHIWPSALRQRELLLGLVDLRGADIAAREENNLKHGIESIDGANEDSTGVEKNIQQGLPNFHTRPMKQSGSTDRRHSSIMTPKPPKRRGNKITNPTSSSHPEGGSSPGVDTGSGESAMEFSPRLPESDIIWDFFGQNSPSTVTAYQQGRVPGNLVSSSTILGLEPSRNISDQKQLINNKEIKADPATETPLTFSTGTLSSPIQESSSNGVPVSSQPTQPASTLFGSIPPMTMFGNQEFTGFGNGINQPQQQQQQQPIPRIGGEGYNNVSNYNNNNVRNMLDTSQAAFFGLPLGADASADEWSSYLPNAFFSATPHLDGSGVGTENYNFIDYQQMFPQTQQ